MNWQFVPDENAIDDIGKGKHFAYKGGEDTYKHLPKSEMSKYNTFLLDFITILRLTKPKENI